MNVIDATGVTLDINVIPPLGIQLGLEMFLFDCLKNVSVSHSCLSFCLLCVYVHYVDKVCTMYDIEYGLSLVHTMHDASCSLTKLLST